MAWIASNIVLFEFVFLKVLYLTFIKYCYVQTPIICVDRFRKKKNKKDGVWKDVRRFVSHACMRRGWSESNTPFITLEYGLTSWKDVITLVSNKQCDVDPNFESRNLTLITRTYTISDEGWELVWILQF